MLLKIRSKEPLEAFIWMVDEVPEWWKDIANLILHVSRKGGVHIRSSAGIRVAYPGDYIIKGSSGDIFPVKPDDFTRIYEVVEVTGD